MKKYIITVNSPKNIGEKPMRFMLALHERGADTQQLTAIYPQQKPYEHTIEMQILNMAAIRNYCEDHKIKNRGLSASSDNQQLHIHYGLHDHVPYICWTRQVISEEDAKKAAERWVLVTVYSILFGQEPNYLVSILNWLKQGPTPELGDTLDLTAEWVRSRFELDVQVNELTPEQEQELLRENSFS